MRYFNLEKLKNNGTGFGLYLVQESLRKMNATIIVDSPVNKTGMNFKIIFKYRWNKST